MKQHKKTIMLLSAAVLLIAVFSAGRYGWKLLGFRTCQGAGIESVEVRENTVKINGFCPGSFPEGFCGYYAEEHGEILYVGFHFSAVFGFLKPAILRLPSPSRARFTGSSTRQEHQKPPSGQLLQALGILNRIKQQGKSREKLLRLVSYCL